MRQLFCLLLLAAILDPARAADGKLIGTPGVTQIEGAGGGGFVPWAQLAGYASRDEVGANVFCSNANVDAYRLTACGAQVNLYDRVELSVAQQRFHVNALDINIQQRILGIKTRLYGDLVYSKWPMLSAGVQFKNLLDPAVANLLGADDDSGVDVYLAASKLHLGAIAGYNWLWNVTARSTEANQLGLLGFGTAAGDDRELVVEASTAILFGRHLAVGAEYRQKPDNLAVREQDWSNVFVAWLPNKHFSLTAAWLNLGDIVGQRDQQGLYFSITGYF